MPYRYPADPSSPVSARRIFGLAALIGFAAIFGVAAPLVARPSPARTAQDGAGNESSDDAMVREKSETERRRQEIAAEIARLPRNGAPGYAWAGEYYEGDGLGMNIRMSLAPKTGVAATWHGCMGLYGANRGKVIVNADGQLRLAYEEDNPEHFGGFPAQLRPVRWGERRYLIPDARMMAFVNAVNHGREPRATMHGMFLLAKGEEKKTAEGLPALPSPYLGMIRSRAMSVGVVAVTRVEMRKDPYGCSPTFRLTLDRGGDDGLAPGVELKVASPSGVWETATVRSAQAASATAEMTVLFDDCVHPKTTPASGWWLTTGAYNPLAAKRDDAGP